LLSDIIVPAATVEPAVALQLEPAVVVVEQLIIARPGVHVAEEVLGNIGYILHV
jgi:hypothetical protein